MAATWVRRASGGSVARTVLSQRSRRVGHNITLYHVTTAGPHCREDPLRAARTDQTLHSGGGHRRHPGQGQAALHTGSQGEML